MYYALLPSSQQSSTDPIGGAIVWAFGLAVVIGLFLVLQRTQKRADAQYWDRKEREEHARDNDPDMRSDNS
jgi:predicted LPLAT superfamily acyltransferase